MEKVSVEPGMVFCPQPMYIIGTRGIDGEANFCPITWITFAWDGAPSVVLSIGEPKRTRENIIREGSFCANQVSRDLLWLGDYCGHTSTAHGPKDRMEHPFAWGQALPVPVLEESRWAFECRLTRTLELDTGVVFVARVENIQIARELAGTDPEQIDLLRLDPVIYAPGGYYSVGERLGGMGEWVQHLPE